METRVLIMQLAYLVSAVLFILGLKRLSHPDTARGGNRLAAIGMLLAIVATLVGEQILTWQWIIGGLLIGSVVGGFMARFVKMTAMPQMVGLFNGFGGLASGLVAAAEYLRYSMGVAGTAEVPVDASISIMLGTLIGAVTFSGSLIAFGKLQGIVTEKAVRYPAQQFLNALLFLGILAVMAYLTVMTPGAIAGADTSTVNIMYYALWGAAMLLGVLLVIPIGGADMPVVVSLLNSYSGLAASAAGFVLNNNVLIISGALVGASGLILTRIMCKAMNRSLANVIFGSFGQVAGKELVKGEKRTMADVNDVQADDVAMLLAYAKQVVVVPGYGLAVAQAQHKLRELCDNLESRGVSVKYVVHPVAGRMPGHMNVLLAEANVPYNQLYEPEDVNPDIANVDACLVVGANDVVNPAARDEPASDLYGMPIIEVDRAKHTVVMKRSLNPGFAGLDNELFYLRNTMMLFGDAADSIGRILEEVKQL
ncbi:MAG: NAD(P)(+) transhydrogenase (Re/Si-specific) subunit beta [Gemmatimonadetes bacterium]|nr:NAD(P)(+) transhydrogenase (Re/Si-specific) subunit beta [Gemmatimonadota bacterium]NNK48389.1 NAD(P)(+) transhydrogenase (Re/Si-specific) subunit beta [Gemmatimonadota bacterium]